MLRSKTGKRDCIPSSVGMTDPAGFPGMTLPDGPLCCAYERIWRWCKIVPSPPRLLPYEGTHFRTSEGIPVSGRQVCLLPGMRDLSGSRLDRFAGLRDMAAAHLAEAGYEPIETPLLEEAELFVRKSGGELASRLYTFDDPGGNRVGLRPEFTPSVIRHFISERSGLSLPVRWCYAGPVFRYEPAGGCRQHTQVGAEVVGGAGVELDAEVLGLAWEGLAVLGLRAELRIGHLGVVQALLRGYGLSEAAMMFVVGNLPALKSASTDVPTLVARAETLGLVQREDRPDALAGPESMSGEDARGMVRAALHGSLSASVGRRTPEQIVARLLRKVENSGGARALENALTLGSVLAGVEGDAEDALSKARGLAADGGLPSGSLDGLSGLLDALFERGIPRDRVVVDLGLARGFAYYTGAVFELIDADSRASLGGGGRYDGLVRTLGGGEDAPALGFAYTLDSVADALEGAAQVGS